MVRLWSLLCALAIYLVPFRVQCLGQETGASLMEVLVANNSAIDNYDVSYHHEFFLSPQQGSKEEPTECLDIGRILVDWKKEQFLYVREETFRTKKGEDKRMSVDAWKEGVWYQLLFKPKKLDLAAFMAQSYFPCVEFTLGKFPQYTKMTRDKYSETLIRAHQEKSRLVRHPDGSAMAIGSPGREVPLQSVIKYDPLSSMPTQSQLHEVDLKTGDILRTISTTTPRYELYNHIYRLVSFEYDRPAFVDKSITMDSVGTCLLTWHQFNEEPLRFPADLTELLNDKAAKRFLIAGGTKDEK
jgi:hypothetical protein